MTTYNTGNPLGSAAAKDLFDNAQNLDYALNDITAAIWLDRRGNSRRSWYGMESAFSTAQTERETEFSEAQEDKETRFLTFLNNAGYVFLGDYENGPYQFSARNQYIRYSSQYYRLNAATDVGFTTTGINAASFANDVTHFVLMDGDTLRQNLASIADGMGGSMVAFIQSGTGAVAQTIQAKNRRVIDAEDYGAVGDGVTDDTVAVQRAINAAGYGEVRLQGNKTYMTGNLTINSPVTISGKSKRSKAAIQAIPGTTGNHITISSSLAPTLRYVDLVGDWTSTGDRLNPTPPSVVGALNAIYINSTSAYSTSIQMFHGSAAYYSGRGLYAAANRNMGCLIYTSILYCAQECFYLASTSDWIVSDCSFGFSLADGLFINCASFRMSSSESYANQGNGITFGPSSTVTRIIGNWINTNGKNGVYYNTQGGVEGHVSLGNMFFANGWKSATAADVVTNAYANRRFAGSVGHFKCADRHFNYGSSTTERRVAYCVYRESTAASLNFEGTGDQFDSFSSTSASASAEVGYSNFDTQATRFSSAGMVLGYSHSLTQYSYTPTSVVQSVRTYYQSFDSLQISPTGLYGGNGSAAPQLMISWSSTRLFLKLLGFQTITKGSLSSGATIPSTDINHTYYSINASNSTFYLPATLSLTDGTLIRFKKIVSSPTYTFLPTVNADSTVATIYGPTGSGLTSVAATTAGTYEFIWDLSNNRWLFS